MSTSSELGVRAVKSSTDAANGYANAAFAAYADFATHAFRMWANACGTLYPCPEPRSWYRHPDQPAAIAGGINPFDWTTWVRPAATPFPWTYPGVGATGAFNPFTMWLQAWPLGGNPAAWPMAFGLMGFGVSRSVAYPLAEANVAALDAVSSAGQAIEQAFSTYRSDGGHATAQIRFATERVTKSEPAPIGWAFLAPWFGLYGQRTD